jgi:hypothetical protein
MYRNLFHFYFCWYKKKYNNFKYFHISSENIAEKIEREIQSGTKQEQIEETK